MTPTIEELARGLSDAGKRSILEMRAEWCCSYNAQGHQYLVGRGLVEHMTGNCGRLTPLGLTLRAYLEKTHG